MKMTATVFAFVCLLGLLSCDGASVHNGHCDDQCKDYEECVNDKCMEPCGFTSDCFDNHVNGYVCVDGYCEPKGSGSPSGYISGGDSDTTPVPTCVPYEEVCDGQDNNCNGKIDELAECCQSGQTRDCGEDIGTCELGQQTCVSFKWGSCLGGVGPIDELCNGVDDDCDGLADEGINLNSDVNNCGVCGKQCLFQNSISSCVGGECTFECYDLYQDKDGLAQNGCEYACVQTNGGVEQCDGIDNDCDWQVDEDFDFTSLDHCGGCGQLCEFANAGAACLNQLCLMQQCLEGFYDLNHNFQDGCEYECTVTGLESCDGTDNDCDGSVDEYVNCGCVNGDKVPCGANVGDCYDGWQTCTNGMWGECDAPTPQPEVCDYHDNDCDGLTDEDFDLTSDLDNCAYCGLTCSVANGTAGCVESVCVVDGCDNGWYDLDGEYENGCEYPCWLTNAGIEACDNLDNDCNGLKDEDFDLNTDALNCGQCGQVCVLYQAVAACTEGACHVESCNQDYYDVDENPLNGCEYDCLPTEEGVEICDGVDNDCDGLTDEDVDCGCQFLQIQICGVVTGECHIGFQVCNFQGEWSECQLEQAPAMDVCDGLDNDCDNLIDEDFDLQTDDDNCGVCGQVCSLANASSQCVAGSCELVQCNPGFYNLDEDDMTGCEYACWPTNGGVEQCDGIDNDCDKSTDEDFDLLADPDNCGQCGVSCDAPHAITECQAGACVWLACEEFYDGLGCNYFCEPTNGGVEIGDNIDNDCDGDIDEGVVCFETNAEPCGSNIGQCMKGWRTCEDGLWSECFEDIVGSLDVCDGVDNDCDGNIDEDFNLATDLENCGACGNVCVLANAVNDCVAGECVISQCYSGYSNLDEDDSTGCEYACFQTLEGEELCDLIDNDCDGEVDEETDVSTDTSNCGACGQVCNFLHAQSTCEGGVCVLGECDDNYWNVNNDPSDGCEYECEFLGEDVCDNIDNDCNGDIDETCDCPEGFKMACGTNDGVCKVGTQTCTNGVFEECVGGIVGSLEICDGLDNDCDTLIDEDFDFMTSLSHCGGCGQSCKLDGANEVCVAGQCELNGCWPGFHNLNGVIEDGCEYACWPTYNGVEQCDYIDNNCDGDEDEGFDLSSDVNNCGWCGFACVTAQGTPACQAGNCVIAECAAGWLNLNGQYADGCEYKCSLSNGGVEIGDNLDNDCDGEVDEGTTCFEGQNVPCGTDVGLCEDGWQICVDGQLTECSDYGPKSEVCDNADNDCDGLTDEDFNLMTDEQNCGACGNVCVAYMALSACVDADCMVIGCQWSFINLNGDYSDGCEYNCLPTLNGVEACDDIDNDCDGDTDEDFDFESDALHCGGCGQSCLALPQVAEADCNDSVCEVQECLSGWTDLNGLNSDGCEYYCNPSNPGDEVCDGVDNDCDGQTDEGCIDPSLITCTICCPAETGQVVVWYGGDPVMVWDSDGESCGVVSMAAQDICLRGSYPDDDYTQAGWFDFNCCDPENGECGGWTPASVIICVDQNNQPVPFEVVVGQVDPGVPEPEGEVVVLDQLCAE